MKFRVLLALTALVAAGCGGGSKLVGTWNTDMQGSPAKVVFDGNGTMSIDTDVAQFGNMHVHMTGTWKEDGKNLAITPTDAQASNLPPQLKGHEEDVNKGMKSGMNIGTEKKNAIAWDNDNMFTLTDEKGIKTVFRRG